MELGTLSSDNTDSVQQSVSMSMLKKRMDAQQQAALKLLQSLDQVAGPCPGAEHRHIRLNRPQRETYR